MAFYAYVQNGIVTNIIISDPEDKKNLPGEEFYVEYFETIDHTENPRKNPAYIGSTYDEENDVFISLKPFASWTLDENFQWVAPVEKPTPDEGKDFYWDEENQQWVEVTIGGGS